MFLAKKDEILLGKIYVAFKIPTLHTQIYTF